MYYTPWALFLWGACWASFFNVVLYRYPIGRSVVRPGSACPRCKNVIKFYDNIPILSWLILRGKCRNCSLAIPIRYLLVEAAGGCLWLIGWFVYPQNPLRGFWLGSTLGLAVALLTCLVRFKRAPWYLWLVNIFLWAVGLVKILLTKP
ncbi:MAG: prepilin peptidase [Acidobacteria bacterium]|nr:prepilin peptidase [Acidobacteriota bacterium]MCB9398678.1 prepilin peptidase [Acidobacteriota bacterium]